MSTLAGQVRASSESPAALNSHKSESDHDREPTPKRPRLASPTPTPMPEAPQPRKRKPKHKKRHAPSPIPGSGEDVLLTDIKSLLRAESVQALLESGKEWDAPFEKGEEMDVEVGRMGGGGESLSLIDPTKPWILVIPFALPGEKVRCTILRNGYLHSVGRLVSVLRPSAERDEGRVGCRYFGKCGGCQYQMLSYEKQLALKQEVVVRAYENYSTLPTHLIPKISPTSPSPLQYAYRTKITPHFDIPFSRRKDKGKAREVEYLNIGFNEQGGRSVLDIEECPIATGVLNDALGPIREECKKKMKSYKKGVTLLLRDSLKGTEHSRDTLADTNLELEISPDSLKQPDNAKLEEEHVCITDHKAIIRERVGDKLFEFSANDFFQNNNSILVSLTSYVKDAIFSTTTSTTHPTHLVDTYCGSGLFSIMLAEHFTHVAGIELSPSSIHFAKQNALLNSIPASKCSFRAGSAEQIFDTVSDFPPSQTAVIIDPPRKGCNKAFIDQVLAFRPSMLVYVSCNVHTQARDVGDIVLRSGEGGKAGYVVESIRGFDLFPQTAHVESVAILRLAQSE